MPSKKHSFFFEELVKKITDHRELRIVKVVDKWDNDDDIELHDAETVQKMWGVQLKKRVKNPRGEEFLFVDPRTRAIGELSRKKVLEQGIFSVSVDESGREVIEGAVTRPEERDTVVQSIRTALSLTLS